MRAPTSAAADEEAGLRAVALWSAPLIALFVAWLWLAFWRGGSEADDWLPVAVFIGVVGLVVGALIAYPRRPRQLSLVVFALLGLYTLWVAASALWAASPSRVWLEAERTSFLLLVFALALIYLTDPRARSLFRYLLMAAALVLLTGCVWRLWTAQEVGLLFQDGRLAFPTGYPNGSAALLLMAFWPLMWLAAGPAERAPVRGVALGLATGLVALAVMTQSRAAIYSLIVTLVIVFMISPIRLRTLLYLIVPGLLLVYAFPLLNRYWLEGPEAVGGGVAARTLVVATLAATFMGTIVALLERWIPASKRMKAIFGTIVLVGSLAAVVYGAIVLTEDDGGPWDWLSRSWRQFASEEEIPLEPGAASRFTTVSSSGAPEFWKTAWRVFESEPIVGVGAGSFTFSYDRLRGDGASNPVPAHSLPLQVLAETGAVGGSLMGLGILLALGGLLWGRSTAAWRHARLNWLRLPGRPLLSGEGSRFCNARWGEDARAYGWEMAVLAALSYWLIHAGFDRLWQITAVAIPALLLLAAGLAAADARVGVMWPRWERWLRAPARGREGGGQTDGEPGGPVAEPQVAASSDAAMAAAEEEAVAAPVRRRPGGGPGESGVFGMRRSDQYVAKWRKRRRREARRQRSAGRMRPAGPLSATFRIVLLVLSALVIIGAVPPYLSSQFQKSALSLAEKDGLEAAARAGTAAWFWPGDPGPLATQGAIYAAGAPDPPPAGAPAVLDDLALSLAAYERAAQKEPASWSLRYHAGIVALNMMIVASGAAALEETLSESQYGAWIVSVPGLEDWTWLAEQQAVAAPTGKIEGSLWPPYGAPDSAHLYRTMTPTQLAHLSLTLLLEARERNPGAPEVGKAIALVRQLGG